MAYDDASGLENKNDDINQGMTQYLDDLRTNDDNKNTFTLKKESNIINRLYKSRENKKKK